MKEFTIVSMIAIGFFVIGFLFGSRHAGYAITTALLPDESGIQHVMLFDESHWVLTDAEYLRLVRRDSGDRSPPVPPW